MIELPNILPKDLEDAFRDSDYDGEDDLIFRSLKLVDNELHFEFLLCFGDNEINENQLWQLQVKNYRDSKIDIENLGGHFSFYTEHFLLWEFTNQETELYFKKATVNPERLLADIYTIHNTIFDNYISIERYINGHNLLTLCNYNNGLFARGPEKILKYYFDCLKKAGMEPYFYGEYIPKKWDGEKWVLEDQDLKVALLGGTYFVGTDFVFIRQK